jgi:MGT family glycosyltransferase
MPNAIFFNVPAHGHVNPSLPLVAELARRGHRITYFVSPEYRAVVEAAGAVFHPYAAVHDDYFDGPGLDGTRPQRAAYHLITTAETILPDLLEIAEDLQPDYIMYDGMCPWGYLIARVLGLPAIASLSLLPLGPPRAMLNARMLRVALPMIARDFRLGVKANRRARSLGRQYNVPPPGMLEILNAPADLSISYTSSHFHPFAGSVPASVRFVGRTNGDVPPSDPFPLDQARGRPVIYVSLGSLINDNPAFFRACIDAFAGSDTFVVISTGHRLRPDAFGALPGNVSVHTWVPQLTILKHAALFVTHGGLGSVHDGLYFGVPLLLVPQQEEQTMTALRVVELGAGLMLTKKHATAEAIRACATRLLTEPHFRLAAERIGDSFRTAGGVVRAVDEIEDYLAKPAKA